LWPDTLNEVTDVDIKVELDQEMKTRDGVTLRADVYRPDTPDPVPAIVLRTPYNKALRHGRTDGLHPVTAAANGFAFVVQDVRGRWASEGEYTPITLHEGIDGYDCIEWVGSQPWCSGRVGMIGGSYESLVQFMAAEQQPPSLGAICPQFSGDSRRGALMLDSILISWAAGQAVDWITKQAAAGEATDADMKVIAETLQDPQAFARWLPLADMPLMQVGSLFTYEQMLGMLRGVGGIRVERIEIPVLMVGGWYDIDPQGSDVIFRRLLAEGGSQCREHSAVVWGPWEHCIVFEHIGERSFGVNGSGQAFGLPQLQLSFFDAHLRGGTSPPPRATWFVSGINRWKSATSWPPPDTTNGTWYLGSTAGANSRTGDGQLSTSQPDKDGEDIFHYDPFDPVPSFGGRFFRVGGSLPGPFDQSRVETRDDVLVYTSPPLDAPLEVAGDAKVTLHFVTDVEDTDIVVKLCDVDPSGLSHNISDNIVRMRWRAGTDEPSFLVPGESYTLTIDLTPVGHVFLAGHCLRLQVTSSNFPAYDRNMNTGQPEGTDSERVVATQRILFGAGTPSRLELEVLS
jgi:uncharacterized protein